MNELRYTPLEFFQSVYQNDELPLSVRMNAATEAAKYMHPQLAAVAHVTEGSFGALLDRAIERSRAAPLKLISAPVEPTENNVKVSVEEQHPASELKGPMAKLRRW